MPKYSQWSYLPHEDYFYVWVFKYKITWLALELKEVLRKMFQTVLGFLEVVDRLLVLILFSNIKRLWVGKLVFSFCFGFVFFKQSHNITFAAT